MARVMTYFERLEILSADLRHMSSQIVETEQLCLEAANEIDNLRILLAPFAKEHMAFHEISDAWGKVYNFLKVPR